MIQCITHYGNSIFPDREVISEENAASRAIVDLVQYLNDKASDEYRDDVITWFLHNRCDLYAVKNGGTTDTWIWSA